MVRRRLARPEQVHGLVHGASRRPGTGECSSARATAVHARTRAAGPDSPPRAEHALHNYNDPDGARTATTADRCARRRRRARPWPPPRPRRATRTSSSFDGTPIVTHFFPAKGLAPGAKAPTILVGHGWAGRGATDIDGGTGEGTQGQTAIGDLHRAGYNVLTWDARGFGGSGGIVSADGPEFEGRDVQSLITYVANQPEARLDAAGDPRLGMAGGSYGGRHPARHRRRWTGAWT